MFTGQDKTRIYTMKQVAMLAVVFALPLVLAPVLPRGCRGAVGRHHSSPAHQNQISMMGLQPATNCRVHVDDSMQRTVRTDVVEDSLVVACRWCCVASDTALMPEAPSRSQPAARCQHSAARSPNSSNHSSRTLALAAPIAISCGMRQSAELMGLVLPAQRDQRPSPIRALLLIPITTQESKCLVREPQRGQ
eukprot:COSAG02_NODE_439_length_22308_cov_18.013508_10_plen_192_part_00